MESGERLKLVREKLGFGGRNMRKFANEINYAQPSISAIESGLKPIPIKIAEILSNRYQINADWLLFEIGEMFSNDSSGNQQTDIENRPNVTFYNIEALAGTGMDVMKNEEVLDRWHIPSLVGDHIAVTIKGNSMESTLMDGDKVIAKRVESPEDIRHNGIYIIVYDGSPIIKRVYLVPGGLELRSDNVFFPAIIAEMPKIGDMYKVVGYYREFGIYFVS